MIKYLIILLSALPFTLSAQDLTPVKTRPITQLNPEKATYVLRSPYFTSILNRKTTIRFVMNVAWFVDSRDDLVGEWGNGISCSHHCNYKVVQPFVAEERSFTATAMKHNDFRYKKFFSWTEFHRTIQKKIYEDDNSKGSYIMMGASIITLGRKFHPDYFNLTEE